MLSEFTWNPVRTEVPSMRKSRKHFYSAEKDYILRERTIDHVRVSEPCNKHGILPTLFQQWRKSRIEDLLALVEHGTRKSTRATNGRIESL